MSITRRAPGVPLSKFKRTKIIATVGPATDSYEGIYDLIDAGANGIRMNFSHGTHEERTRQIAWVRKASRELDKPVAIIQDLQGPKLRLGDFEGIINVQRGQGLVLAYKADYAKDGIIPTQYDISGIVKRGEPMMLYDGKIRTTITSVQGKVVHARAENSGILIKRKGMNLPKTDFVGHIITKKDKEDIAYGSTRDIDFVALSFVQRASDIESLRRQLKTLGSTAKIIAKIETGSAVEHIEEIMQSADAVMIARGDLAIETPSESVPVVQRQIIGLGMHYKKPTIVATQMMASMMEAPEPTRAEVSDVATAVIVGADCVMLSDETANGKYPKEAVEMMKKVILYTQNNSPLRATFYDQEALTPQNAVANAIIRLADSLEAKAIVAETKSGATVNSVASHRPDVPIIAVTSEARVAQQLSITYGSKSYIRPISKLAATKLTNWLLENKVLKPGEIVVTASGQHPGVVGSTDTIKVRVL